LSEMKPLSMLLTSIIFILGVHGQLFAQTKKDEEKKALPENIEQFDYSFSFRPKLVTMGNVLQIVNKEDKSEKINWKTYSPGITGFNLKIKKFIFGIAFKLPSSDALESHYVKTTFRDIQVRIRSRITEMHFFYSQYKGFYLLNPSVYYPNWRNGDHYPNTPQTNILNIGANFTFQTTKNFSMNAAFVQNERQKKSKGSLLLMVSPRLTTLLTNTSLVPGPQQAELPYTYHLRKASFGTLVTGGGMGYSFIGWKGKFNVTPVWMVGSGLQVGKYNKIDNERTRIRIPVFGQARMAIGWNGDKFFTNIIGTSEVNTFGLRDTKMRFVHYGVEFGVGVRF